MLDLTQTPDDLLAPTRAVVKAALAAVPQLSPNDLMIVGARCRDILHGALGHAFATTATLDLDLALALSSWDAYRSLASAFPKASDSGICYRIDGLAVDLLPFGDVEDPDGVVEPPPRREPMSVWAFEEIYAAAAQLSLSNELVIQIPTVAGYTAAKLGVARPVRIRPVQGRTGSHPRDVLVQRVIGRPEPPVRDDGRTGLFCCPRIWMFAWRRLISSVSTSQRSSGRRDSRNSMPVGPATAMRSFGS